MELIIAIVSVLIAIVSMAFSVVTYGNTASHDRKQVMLEVYNHKVLSGYLARTEHFCIGVNEDIYDKDVFYKMAYGYFDGQLLRKRIEPILASKNGSKGSEIYYINIYSILELMDKKSEIGILGGI